MKQLNNYFWGMMSRSLELTANTSVLKVAPFLSVVMGALVFVSLNRVGQLKKSNDLIGNRTPATFRLVA
jgi:hypothetical protein